MTARQIIVPGAMPSRDANGRSLPAKLRFYLPDTSTPATVYTTAALDAAHPFPLNSDSAGRFPPVWAEETLWFDVAWSRFDSDAMIAGYEGVRPLSDALIASATLAQSAADAAAASAVVASEFADDAATSASAADDAIDVVDDLVEQAETARDEAQQARDEAVAIAGFNPALYQTRAEEGQAGGYAGLDGSGKVPDVHLTEAPVSTDQAAAIAAAQAVAIKRAVGLALIF